MTDLEISKALALAIGWTEDLVSTSFYGDAVMVDKGLNWRKFDYRDWNVIAPIAAKYDCFPHKIASQLGDDFWWAWTDDRIEGYGDTPQKAIALAVIGART